MVANNATSSGIPDPRHTDVPRVPPVPGSNAQRSEPELVSSPSPSAPLPLSPSAPVSSSPSSPRSSASSAFNSSLDSDSSLRPSRSSRSEADSPPRPPDYSATSAFSSPSLLHAFIAANYNINTLLTDPRFTPDEIMAFLADPETQAKLTDIAKIAHLGLTIRAAEARHIAIAALEVCATEADDLVEKRRAAHALYRATCSPLIPLARAHDSRATGCLSTSAPAPPPLPPAPEPLDTPRPDLNPDNITRIVSQALLINRNNTPEVGTGFATLNAFLTPDVTICGTQLPDSSDFSDSDPASSSSSSSPSPSAPLPLSPSAPSSPSPLRHSASSATSAFSSSSPSLAARRIAAIRETPLGELDGHCWCMAHDLDEPGDALTKIHTWFVPRKGGVRHFTFTLETKLFHFPEAQPDCWYITSIDQCDPIALRRAREQQQKEQREQEKRRKQHPPNRPTPPADDKPP